MIPELDTQQIIEMKLPELYDTYLLLRDTDELTQQEIQQTNEAIEEGTTTKFPITHIIQEWYELYPTTGNAKILGHQKIPLKNFLKEIKKRETILRNIILTKTQEQEIINPR